MLCLEGGDVEKKRNNGEEAAVGLASLGGRLRSFHHRFQRERDPNKRMETDESLLRVHSDDLHHHVAEEVGSCFETGLYTDLVLRCKGGKAIHAHKLVLAAVSPLMKRLIEWNVEEDITYIDLPDVTYDNGQLLVDVVYNGMVEATMEELKALVLLARHLSIEIPVSNDLLSTLGLPPMPPKLKLASMPKPEKLLKTLSSTLGGNANADTGLPPPLKRIKEDLPHLSVLPNSNRLSTELESQQPKEYLCPFCNSKYNNSGAYKQHMRFHENEAQKEERNQMMNEVIANCYTPENNLYTCEICRSTYSHPGNFKQHLGKHERDSGAVTILHQQMQLQRGLAPNRRMPLVQKPGSNSHLNNALQSAFADRVDNGDAPALKQYHCDICGRTFKHPGNHKQHMASHMRMTTVVPYANVPQSCLNCNEPCRNAEELRRHMPVCKSVVGGEGGVFKCEICDDTYLSSEALAKHKRLQHSVDESSSPSPSNLFQCDADGCLQSFSRVDYLAKHKEVDHGIASSSGASLLPLSSFQCNVCQKVFPKMAKLAAHMKIHSAPEEHYRYPCDICGKKFTRPQHVTRHKLLHTGEKPFRCEKCDKPFNREDKLKEHLQKDCNALPVVVGHEMDDEEESITEMEEEEEEVEIKTEFEEEDIVKTEIESQ